LLCGVGQVGRGTRLRAAIADDGKAGWGRSGSAGSSTTLIGDSRWMPRSKARTRSSSKSGVGPKLTNARRYATSAHRGEADSDWSSVAFGARANLRNVARHPRRKTTHFNHLRNPYKIGRVLRFGERRPERTNSGHRPVDRSPEVCVQRPAVIGLLCAPARPQRTLVPKALAEGVILGSNGL
jgi:hypothetical protein